MSSVRNLHLRSQPTASPKTTLSVSSAIRFACFGFAFLSFLGLDDAKSAPDSEAKTELTSDFIDRPLPNPTREVIQNWAKLPDGLNGDRRLESILVLMDTSGPTTDVAESPSLADATTTQNAILSTNSIAIQAI